LASKRQEVAARAAQADAQTQAQAKTRTSRSPWDSGDRATYSSGMGADPLEEQFQRWEMDEELEQLKRQMGRP
jgi:hypothetical protein